MCVSESERCSCSNAVRPRRRSLQRYGRVYLLSILNPPSSKALHRRWRQRRTAGRYASKCFSLRSRRPSLAANQRPNTATFPHALSLRCSKSHKNALHRKGAARRADSNDTVGWMKCGRRILGGFGFALTGCGFFVCSSFAITFTPSLPFFLFALCSDHVHVAAHSLRRRSAARPLLMQRMSRSNRPSNATVARKP